MHYSNGRPAKKGDIIKAQTYAGAHYIGLVIATNEQSDTCNLQVVPLDIAQCFTVTAKEAILADDLTAKPYTEELANQA